jgi:UDP:flavonoid glycosyltransferase YjiC (YdhE family)
MARYLAYTSPARGHLYPIVPTLVELRDRGHEVHVRTLASELDALRSLDLHAEAIAAEIEATPLRDFEGSSLEKALGRALETFAARATHEVPDLQRAIAAVEPHALMVDIMTVGAAAVAEAGRLPWAHWMPLFQRFSPDPSIPSWVSRVPFGIAPEPGLAVMNGPRAALGLPPLAGPEEMWRAQLHLYYTAPPFELDLDFPSSFRFVGPGVWEPPAPEPVWLAGLDAPLVLVSVSSEFQHDAALIQTALDAFAQEHVIVAVSTAAHDPAAFDAPPNAHVARWLPHRQLLAKAACMICHGGMGIAQKALAAGVPACVVPFGRDQFEVAARVAAVGAGTCLMPDALNADTLRRAVEEAIGMRPGARVIADAFAQSGGAPAAAAALESQLAMSIEGAELR